MSFNPSRFLGYKPEPDPRQICFGFGRRYVIVRLSIAVLPLTFISVEQNLSRCVFGNQNEEDFLISSMWQSRTRIGWCIYIYFVCHELGRFQHFKVHGRWANNWARCRSNDWHYQVWWHHVLTFEHIPGWRSALFFSHPTDFQCTIKPRSAKAVALINCDVESSLVVKWFPFCRSIFFDHGSFTVFVGFRTQ
jgi:hypothetical protein